MGVIVNQGLVKSFTANETITIGKAVKLDADGGALVAGNGDPLVGVAMGGYYVKQSGGTTEDQVVSGEKVDVAMLRSGNIVRMKASATLAPNGLVQSDASGFAGAHSAASGEYNKLLGTALTAAASGEEVKILL